MISQANQITLIKRKKKTASVISMYKKVFITNNHLFKKSWLATDFIFADEV